MRSIPWFLHPVLIFIGSLVAIIISLVLFIYWSLKAKFGVENFIEKFNITQDPLLELNTWVTIFTLSILVVVIIVGVSIIYTYYQKTINLYRLQNNFINNFTHELKTPLTSINLFLETLEGHELGREDQVKYIGYMKNDASRLWNIINHILSTAKIESNSYQRNFSPVNLRELVQSELFSNEQLSDQIDIHISGEGNYHFYGDEELLRMLVSNILTNSIKYNESSCPRLDVNFKRSGKQFIINFKDNGIGIGSTDVKNIFKKFYQVGDSIDVSAKGSGLGLFLSQTIASIHKIKLSATSEGPGRGSTFTLSCPLKHEIEGDRFESENLIN